MMTIPILVLSKTYCLFILTNARPKFVDRHSFSTFHKVVFDFRSWFKCRTHPGDISTRLKLKVNIQSWFDKNTLDIKHSSLLLRKVSVSFVKTINYFTKSAIKGKTIISMTEKGVHYSPMGHKRKK